MHILRTNFNGSPNVGLYGYATSEYLLLGESLPEGKEQEVAEALGSIPVHQLRIAGTGLLGVFLAGNARTLLVPPIAFPNELKQLTMLKIPYVVIETNHTCLGNTIACNDHGAVISTEFSAEEKARIEEALGVRAIQLDIADLKSPGSFLVLNNDRGIVHRDVSEEDKARIEEALKVELFPATANLGTPYLHAGILSNRHGFVVGDASGGPEIVHIDEALGYGESDE